MKKYLFRFGLAFIAPSMLISALSSCSSPIEKLYDTLSTPVLSINNSTGVVSWDAVEHADYYRYYINGGEFQTTTNTSLTLQEGQSVSVMADTNSVYQPASLWSSAVSYINVDETYKYANITFHDAPGMNTLTHPKGTPLHITSTPTKFQYTFDGWYKDPYFEESFVDGTIIDSDTMLYAKWVTPIYMNANFFVKCNKHISNSEKGYNKENPSSDSWGFIPLHYDAAVSASLGNRKAYTAIVTSDASSSESTPAEYLIMDGVDDLTGRKYWKSDGDANFTIKSAGTWRINFSIEYAWMHGETKIHAHLEPYSEQASYSPNKFNLFTSADLLPTPIVTVNKNTSKATWQAVEGASKYRYRINNGEVMETNSIEVNLYQGQHITVQAVASAETLSSKWSIPVVYNYSEPITKDYHYVTFFNSDVASIKVNNGNKATNPGTPTKVGYTFAGWYDSVTLSTQFDFDKTITKNTNIYAKWTEITATNRYFLMSPSNTKVTELHLNTKQTSFNEYYATFKVASGAKGIYKVVDSLDSNRVLYTHDIQDDAAEYQICFSFDHLYDNNRFATINHTRYNLYFTNRSSWGYSPSAYYWSDSISGRKVGDWPGAGMTYVKTNSYGEDIYTINLYKDYYEYIIFNNSNNGKQTVNISLSGVTDNTQWWCNGDKDSSGKYKVDKGTYNG